MTRFMGIVTFLLTYALYFGNTGIVYAQNHSKEVTFTSGDAVFSGTLAFPEGSGPYPAVVMISGMGQQDRDWSFVGGKYKFAKGIADHFTARGIAVLRYDDRGHGKSTGTPETETGFDLLADDVLAAVTMLRSRNDITAIGLCGHSLGGIIAPYMQTKYNAADFIIIISGSFIPGEQISIDQAKTMPAREFKALAASVVKQFKEAVRQGKLDAFFTEGFEPQAHLRPLKRIEEEFRQQTEGPLVIAAENCTTPLDGWLAALQWAMHLDRKSVKEQEEAARGGIRRKWSS